MAHICGNAVLSGFCKRMVIEKCHYKCGAIRPVKESSAKDVPTFRRLKDLADWVATAAPDTSEREWPDEIDAMLADGRLDRVEADLEAALVDMQQAQLRVRTARRSLRDDAGGAISSAWEAMRLALTAHMLTNGIRASNRRGGFHATTAAYGIVALSPLDPAGEFDRLDEARDLRAAVSYRHVSPDRSAADATVRLAEKVVAAVADELGA